MIHRSATALLLTMLAVASSGAAPPAPIELAQLIVREQIMIRMRRNAPLTAPTIEWQEERGPRCIAAKSIKGATMLGQNSVDLILRDNNRLRARLERRCPALDFYHGFYIRPDPDGRVCADRDSIRSRVGGQCEIERFRTLRPAAKLKRAGKN